ncbi:MAG: tetratricopeptide repeat protein [Myxococcales bacterium]|nr:tetratricopeptide repeat protein [Myxococcales bacterium]
MAEESHEQERAVVKRIKKRIPKADELENEGGAVNAGAEDGEAPDLQAEIRAMGEDDFTRRVAGGFGWMVANRTLFIGLAVAGLIAVGAIYLMQNQKASEAGEAAAAFQAAADAYREAIEPPAAPEAAEGEAPAVDPAEARARLEKAQQGFARTREVYSDRALASLAALGDAGAKFDLGDLDGAIAAYDAALAAPNLDSFSRAIALQGKAAALEGKGDQAGAIATWHTLESLDQKAFGLIAGVQIGRLLEATGKDDDARQLYKRLQADHADALNELSNRTTKADLERRLARLGDAT